MPDVNPKADVLIITVTKVESRAVMRVFWKATGKAPKPERIGDRIYHNLGEVNGARVFMALSQMGAGGLGASQQAVQKGITALRPLAVIMVGIAFGVNEQKQTIGDILVAQQLWLYDLQRIGIDRIIPRGDKPHASTKLIDYLKGADLYWQGAEVRFGLILTGEKLVDNVDYREQLKQLEPEAIGGEMEGAGLYVACQDAHVDWILVKAICDWGDGNKAEDKDARQQLAAHNAVSFVLHALQQARFMLSPPEERLPVIPGLDNTGKASRYKKSTIELKPINNESQITINPKEDTDKRILDPIARLIGALTKAEGFEYRQRLFDRLQDLQNHIVFIGRGYAEGYIDLALIKADGLTDLEIDSCERRFFNASDLDRSIICYIFEDGFSKELVDWFWHPERKLQLHGHQYIWIIDIKNREFHKIQPIDNTVKKVEDIIRGFGKLAPPPQHVQTEIDELRREEIRVRARREAKSIQEELRVEEERKQRAIADRQAGCGCAIICLLIGGILLWFAYTRLSSEGLSGSGAILAIFGVLAVSAAFVIGAKEL